MWFIKKKLIQKRYLAIKTMSIIKKCLIIIFKTKITYNKEKTYLKSY